MGHMYGFTRIKEGQSVPVANPSTETLGKWAAKVRDEFTCVIGQPCHMSENGHRYESYVQAFGVYPDEAEQASDALINMAWAHLKDASQTGRLVIRTMPNKAVQTEASTGRTLVQVRMRYVVEPKVHR